MIFYNTQYIDHFLQSKKISKEEFCKKCNIDINLLHRIYNQERFIKAFDIIPILKLLNISCDTFLFMENFSSTKKST